MGFAILRTQKLKSGIAVRRSLTHAFRERETPNADPSRTQENTHIGAKDVDQALTKFNALLPEKVRKNAVLAVEYLITGSPEDMAGKSRGEQDAYFRDSLEWLKRRHGAHNVVYAGIHRDETTPHMYAYVVPLDSQGKLNCRSFLGGAKALREMQTDFAEEVGKRHDLRRGLEGSKAHHTRIQHYYAKVNEAVPHTRLIEAPEPKLMERKEAYGDRVVSFVLEQMKPEVNILRAKAAHAELAQKDTAAAVQARDSAELRLAQQARLLEVERAKLREEKTKVMQLYQVIVAGGVKLQELQEQLRKKFELAKIKTQGRTR